MGFWFQSIQSPRPAGEVLKWKYYRLLIRVLIFLGTTASIACLLLPWTQQLDLQNLTLNWDKNRSALLLCPSHNMTESEEAPRASPLNITEGNETLSSTGIVEKRARKKVEAPVAAPQTVKGNGTSSPSLTAEDLRRRGVGLLHGWTDSELFVRAGTYEKTLLAGKTNSTSRKPKIAFMFLIRDDLPFMPLWHKFFKGHEDVYNIYTHMWPMKLSAFQGSKGVFWGRMIPSQEGKRLTPGLIADARRLMANALLDDPANEWFAMISESCIPVHGFQHVYKTLASTNKSFVDSYPRHFDMWNRYRARGDDAMEPEIQFSQFRMGSQFWVMRRRHAVMTVGDSKYWTKFNRPCLEKYKYCFPEEHYFATLLNILDPKGWYHSATLVDWSKMEPGGHPRRFRAWEINEKLIRDLQRKWSGEFLFARKFDPDCIDPLMDNVKVILEH